MGLEQASKSQYETQFKKWGSRKNLKRKEWQEAIEITADRERQGKRSKVVIDGIPISAKQLDRERARYGMLHTGRNTIMSRAPSTTATKSVVVYTPAPSPMTHGTTPIADTTTDLQLYDHQWKPEVITYEFSYQNDFYAYNLPSLVHDPFSWMTTLDWVLLQNFTRDTHQLIKHSASPLDHKALLHQTHQVTTVCPQSDTDAIHAQYLVTLLLNDIQTSSNTSLDNIHEWLRNLPRAAVLQFFKALPAGHSDILRERVFAAATRAGNEETVQLMLGLGLDPGQMIETWDQDAEASKFPLCTAMMKDQVPIAKAIVKHFCCAGSTQNFDNILEQVLSCYSRWTPSKRNYLYPEKYLTSSSDWFDITIRLLDAGAKPTLQCFSLAEKNPVLLQPVLHGCKGRIMDYIQIHVLRHCLDEVGRHFDKEKCNQFLKPVLSYFLRQMIHEISKHDPATVPAFWEALQSASKIRCAWAISVILNAAMLLGIELGHAEYDDATNAVFISACRYNNWLLIEQLNSELSYRDTTKTVPEPDLRESIEAALEAAKLIRRRDGDFDLDGATSNWNYLMNRLRTEDAYGCCGILNDGICRAIDVGCDEITLALSSRLDLTHFQHSAIFEMLERIEIATISQIVCQNEHWKAALLCARHQCDFEPLEDIIYRKQMYQESIHEESESFPPDVAWQITLRVLSYHAIYTSDYPLLTWLLQMGLCTSELYGTYNISEGRMSSLLEISSYSIFKTRDYMVHSLDHDEYPVHMFSLLGVAASHNDGVMVQFLLNQGITCGISAALMLAVGVNADEALLKVLLEVSGDSGNLRPRNFGTSALRAAVFKKNYDVLHLLSARVDIDGIDILDILVLNCGRMEGPPLSPLGEAIRCQDLRAAEILIERGASLNVLVTFVDYAAMGLNNANGTELERASPLLAAIDTENLPMIQLLVANRADIDHSPRLGLVRTPLQRAAEIGNFDIVQYLLECKASFDSAPCYSGGTPLQLTALKGHTGIASLLLENGANVNHLPARGDGRTALEAAAEWNHPDMMTLLVSHGVKFELIVDDRGRTQYERALGFAEKQGRPASKRFLERLWAESGAYSFNMQSLH